MCCSHQREAEAEELLVLSLLQCPRAKLGLVREFTMELPVSSLRGICF